MENNIDMAEAMFIAKAKGGDSGGGIVGVKRSITFKNTDGDTVTKTILKDGCSAYAPLCNGNSYTWKDSDGNNVTFPYTPILDEEILNMSDNFVLTIVPISKRFLKSTDGNPVDESYGDLSSDRWITIDTVSNTDLPYASNNHSYGSVSVRLNAEKGWIFGSYGSSYSVYNSSVLYKIKNSGFTKVNIKYLPMTAGGPWHSGYMYVTKDGTVSGSWSPATSVGGIHLCDSSMTEEYYQSKYGTDWTYAKAIMDDSYGGWVEASVDISSIGLNDDFYLWFFENDGRWAISKIWLS